MGVGVSEGIRQSCQDRRSTAGKHPGHIGNHQTLKVIKQIQCVRFQARPRAVDIKERRHSSLRLLFLSIV